MPLIVAYDASKCCGPLNLLTTKLMERASFVLAMGNDKIIAGGHNPKGQSSMISTHPLVAAFHIICILNGAFQELQKVRGGRIGMLPSWPKFRNIVWV